MGWQTRITYRHGDTAVRPHWTIESDRCGEAHTHMHAAICVCGELGLFPGCLHSHIHTTSLVFLLEDLLVEMVNHAGCMGRCPKADGKGGGWHHGPHTLVRVLPTISSTVVRLDFCPDQCWFLGSTSLVRLLTIDSSSPRGWREWWIIRVFMNSRWLPLAATGC
jgi:hypothetical protein